jgi:hypothetical protein
VHHIVGKLAHFFFQLRKNEVFEHIKVKVMIVSLKDRFLCQKDFRLVSAIFPRNYTKQIIIFVVCLRFDLITILFYYY